MVTSGYVLVTILFTAVTARHVGDQAEDCKGRRDGLLEHECKSFKSCRNGQVFTTTCQGSTVFNQESGHCDEQSIVLPPCGDYRDCSLLDDATYPDPGCHSFYTCNGGIYIGHGSCSGGLVYSSKIHGCDWPDYTPPPCGTQGRDGQLIG